MSSPVSETSEVCLYDLPLSHCELWDLFQDGLEHSLPLTSEPIFIQNYVCIIGESSTCSFVQSTVEKVVRSKLCLTVFTEALSVSDYLHHVPTHWRENVEETSVQFEF